MRPAHAELENLINLVPADVLAFYTVDPPAGEAPGGAGNSLQIATVLIDQAFAMGFLKSLDITLRGWLDTIASLSVVTSHPHVVMLLDLQVQKDEHESHRVTQLRAAVVLHTRGEHRSIERRIQHLLDSYSDREHSNLGTVEAGRHLFHRLSDDRLTEWMDLCWGAAGEYFIIAIGEESAGSIVAMLENPARSIGNSTEFRQGSDALGAANALVTLLIRFEAVRTHSKALGAKLASIQKDLGMPGARTGFWAAGYAGRSLEIRQWLQYVDNGRAATVSSEQYHTGRSKELLPAEVNSFAVFGIDPKTWFERIRAAYLSARSRKNALESREYWRKVEQDAGLRFVDLFSSLGGPVVVHDYPVHALRLPPAWTIVVPLQGTAEVTRKGVDSLLTFWSSQLADTPLRLMKNADGIWFLNVGLEGPAVMVTDRYLVLSFSPQAVRQVLDQLNSVHAANP